jgi:OOP family OmpA-OmpF porin
MTMKYIFTKNRMFLAVSCALALGALPVAATAQTNPRDTGYLSGPSSTVVKSAFGLCWHTGGGPPAAPTAECDPDFVQKPFAQAVVPAAPPPAASPVMPEPAPQAAAPIAPAPIVRPVAERFTFDADALFDFDKSVLRPAGRVALDEFVAKIRDFNPEAITAVGHADRFGSEQYNQHLSEQRVETVKAYLVGKGIDAARIQAIGKGETQPVTKAGECDGPKSARVIACLQPDRRVEIELVSSRIAAR